MLTGFFSLLPLPDLGSLRLHIPAKAENIVQSLCTRGTLKSFVLVTMWVTVKAVECFAIKSLDLFSKKPAFPTNLFYSH